MLEKIGYPWPNDRGNLNNKPAREADLGEAETIGFDGVASTAGEALPMSVTAGTSGQEANEANGLLAQFSGNESTDAAIRSHDVAIVVVELQQTTTSNNKRRRPKTNNNKQQQLKRQQHTQQSSTLGRELSSFFFF